jgi:cardiolipin synthase A/B
MHVIPWAIIYVGFGWFIRAAMVPVVLRRQLAPGASWAWLGIVFLHPYIGIFLYWLVGETRLGPVRAARHRQLVEAHRGGRSSAGTRTDDAAEVPSEYQPMVLQAQRISEMPVLPDNAMELITDTAQLVARLVTDIDAAKSHVHLLYYMFEPDQTGERVVAALMRAAQRGVRCRVLADAVASRPLLQLSILRERLESAGVQVAAALPVAPIRRRLPRMDLRNHRKMTVIDGAIAYAGSHNLINPDYGGRRGAPWFDLTGRFTGPVVDELAIVFQEDWAFETGDEPDGPTTYDLGRTAGSVPMQVVPTGPSFPNETYRRVLLAAIQSARRRLILTTPYFVPDEPTLVALAMAADRGVEVTLVLPLVPDHIFTAAAGRAHFARLMASGIQIWQYRPGLLHAKATTVDDAFAMIGSANIDVRSFNLNFELSVLMYGQQATDAVRAVQMAYLADSQRLDAEAWNRRGVIRRYADGAISLLSPVL